MQRLKLEQIPFDIINHYRVKRKRIHKALKKGSSNVTIYLEDHTKDVWNKKGQEWSIKIEKAATSFETRTSKPKYKAGTLWGFPVKVKG